MSSFLVWLRGLGAAVIGGISSSVTLLVVDPAHFNFQSGFTPLWHTAVVSGLLAAAGYLKQSPLPCDK